MAGLTLDTGALIAAERFDRTFWSYWQRARRTVAITIPAPVIAQAWRGAASARLAMVINGATVEPLTEEIAKAAGELLARAGTADAIDAVVVVSAASRGDMILTSDPDDLRHLAGFAPGGVNIVAV